MDLGYGALCPGSDAVPESADLGGGHTDGLARVDISAYVAGYAAPKAMAVLYCSSPAFRGGTAEFVALARLEMSD